MSLALSRATCAAVADIEQVDFQVALNPDGGVLLRTRLRYDLHVRPATYIYGRLHDSGFFDKLRLRRPQDDQWVDFQPLSLVALSLSRGEEIEIRVEEPVTRDSLLLVMDAFRGCPLFRDYAAPSPVAEVSGAETEFDKEFRSDDCCFTLIRLNLENFIIGRLAEVEGYVLNNCQGERPCAEKLHQQFQSLLFDDLEHFGMMSLDVPLDNLMQTRDMCYHLHFKQLESQRRIPYALIGIEWGQENALAWRRNQMQRHRYFYERESDYYRDLFLVLVLREEQRLERFVSYWRDRIDFSLRLRRELPLEMRRVQAEMDNFKPNFDNPEEFCSHIRLMSELVIRDLSRLNPYLELIREKRIFHFRA